MKAFGTFLIFLLLVAGGITVAWKAGYLSLAPEALPFADKGEAALDSLPLEIRAFVRQDTNRALRDAYLAADREMAALRRSIPKARTEAEREEQINRLFDAGFARLKAVRGIADTYIATHERTLVVPGSASRTTAPRPMPVTFGSSEEITFRDTTGRAQIWYARKREGEGYDLFKGTGQGVFKTDDGRPMHLAETPTVQREIAAYVDGERERREAAEREQVRRRYVSWEYWNATERVDVVVCVRRGAGNAGTTLEPNEAKMLHAAAIRGCTNAGRSVNGNLLSDAFALNEYTIFDSFFSGEPGRFASILALPCDELLLVRCEYVKLNKGGTYGVITCEAELKVVRMRPFDGRIVETFTLKETGPGISSDRAAREAVFTRLAEALAKRVATKR